MAEALNKLIDSLYMSPALDQPISCKTTSTMTATGQIQQQLSHSSYKDQLQGLHMLQLQHKNSLRAGAAQSQCSAVDNAGMGLHLRSPWRPQTLPK